MEVNGNLLSYKTILDDVKRFTGRLKDDGYGRFDDKRHVYFKILFYFNNKGNSVESWTSNLLGLDISSGENVNNDVSNETYNATNWNESTITTSAGNSVNTAYNYLMLNDELERAEYLKRFILLLSEISSNSPWMFQSLTGLDQAMERSFYKDAVVAEERKSINIKCMEDTYDNKISTLLDLYKAACYSHINKKEIIPSNLRKFDMGVYVFSSPIRTIHSMFSDYCNKDAANYSTETLLKGVVTGTDVGAASGYFTSCKYFEFHNCEFDMNNGKDAYSEMTIAEPKTLEHTITIHYDDVLESNYNEFLTLSIGDFVAVDMIESYANLEVIRSANEIKEADVTSGVDKLKYYNTDNNTNNELLQHQKTFREISTERSNNGLRMIDLSYDPDLEDYYSGTYERDFSSNSSDRNITSANMVGLTWDESEKDYRLVDKNVTSSTTTTTSTAGSNQTSIFEDYASQIVGAGVSWVENKITSLLLGNAHGLSLSNTVSDMSSGNVFTVVGSVLENAAAITGSASLKVGDNAHKLTSWTKKLSLSTKNIHGE